MDCVDKETLSVNEKITTLCGTGSHVHFTLSFMKLSVTTEPQWLTALFILCRKEATWLQTAAYEKGQPEMTAAIFASWVNNELLPNSHLPLGFPRSITPCTACKWLHDLGFSPTSYRKGVYIDGHEREDVIQYRKLYL